MPFGYRYWMVYLPQIEPASFLLFVHNPEGATRLRNYASGKEQAAGRPSVEMVFRATQDGKTRHECEPHRTDDDSYWSQKTQEMNRRFLAGRDARPAKTASPDRPAVESRQNGAPMIPGRALRGSQRQLQDYVNHHADVLSEAILEQLPGRIRELEAGIRWVSPLAEENYREYRDAEFLERVGLTQFSRDLEQFWPGRGPSWDALGIISDSLERMKPGVILVEAKSHILEIYGSGCQASPQSRHKIETALELARSWCGVTSGESWLGPLYQYANRIAHLFFFHQRLRVPAWLVNLYFTNDPIGPADRAAWEREVKEIKARLGFTKPVPNMVEVYVPALDETDRR